MATTTDRLPISHKHYLKPTQNGRATFLDEVRFVEEMIENPLMLERYGLEPYFEKMLYKFLMDYAYTVLDLRGKDVADYMFNTMREVAVKWQELKGIEDKDLMENAFDYYMSYGEKVCYGGQETTWNNYTDKHFTHTYKPMQLMYAQQSINCWEFLMSVRPLTFTENIVIYKSEVDKILEVFGDDLHKILVAYYFIVRAKLYESSRCYWDNVPVVDKETGEVFKRNQNSEAKHWNTPFTRERNMAYKHGIRGTRSRLVKHELGIEDKRGIATIYNEVAEELFNAGLFIDISKLSQRDVGNIYVDDDLFDDYGYCTVKDFDKKTGEVVVKEKNGRTCAKGSWDKAKIGAYKPTFLKLHSDEEVAFELDYYTFTHGYVFDMFVYLCSINHSTVKGVKCRIETCKECGNRFLVYMDGTKGRTSSYCVECSDSSARMRRSRAKKR